MSLGFGNLEKKEHLYLEAGPERLHEGSGAQTGFKAGEQRVGSVVGEDSGWREWEKERSGVCSHNMGR